MSSWQIIEKLPNLNLIKSINISSDNVLNAIKIAAGLATLYVVYKAGKIYIIRRKYRHIPGPPTKG